MISRRQHVSLVLLITALLPVASEAAKKKAAPEAYGLVSGSVFQESGFALPSAEVMLTPVAAAEGPTVKVKPLRAVSDARGEFVFRVPAASMSYSVKVAAKGYQAQEKSVAVQGEERVEVTFQLQRESK